jgi:hypothetical protein
MAFILKLMAIAMPIISSKSRLNLVSILISKVSTKILSLTLLLTNIFWDNWSIRVKNVSRRPLMINLVALWSCIIFLSLNEIDSSWIFFNFLIWNLILNVLFLINYYCYYISSYYCGSIVVICILNYLSLGVKSLTQANFAKFVLFILLLINLEEIFDISVNGELSLLLFLGEENKLLV